MRRVERLCAFGLVAFGITTISVSAATTSGVVCTTDTWTINREGNTPCIVAAALEGACFNDVWNIDPLGPNQIYSGPVGGNSNPCQCNTVAYSMVAACGACQGHTVSTWSQWIYNCTPPDVTVGSYPRPIPAGVSVPAWAYLDVTSGGTWDPTRALAVANSNTPESAGGGAPPTTKTAGVGASPSGAPPPPSAVPSSKTGSLAGPIAGGVVGGVAFLALLGVAGFFVRRRIRARRGDPPGPYQPSDGAILASPVQPSFLSSSGVPSTTVFSAHQHEPPKLYDPSDPTTFPSPEPSMHTLPGYVGPGGAPVNAPPMMGYASPPSSPPHPQYNHGQPAYVPPATGPGAYRGIPEV